MATQLSGDLLGTQRCCDVESTSLTLTSLTLIQRHNNVMCPVVRVYVQYIAIWYYSHWPHDVVATLSQRLWRWFNTIYLPVYVLLLSYMTIIQWLVDQGRHWLQKLQLISFSLDTRRCYDVESTAQQRRWPSGWMVIMIITITLDERVLGSPLYFI